MTNAANQIADKVAAGLMTPAEGVAMLAEINTELTAAPTRSAPIVINDNPDVSSLSEYEQLMERRRAAMEEREVLTDHFEREGFTGADIEFAVAEELKQRQGAADHIPTMPSKFIGGELS
jgi:hypothetical protein